MAVVVMSIVFVFTQLFPEDAVTVYAVDTVGVAVIDTLDGDGVPAPGGSPAVPAGIALQL